MDLSFKENSNPNVFVTSGKEQKSKQGRRYQKSLASLQPPPRDTRETQKRTQRRQVHQHSQQMTKMRMEEKRVTRRMTRRKARWWRPC